MRRLDQFGWTVYGNGQLQTYRAEGIRIIVWVGWHRELRAQWGSGSLTLRWRRYEGDR